MGRKPLESQLKAGKWVGWWLPWGFQNTAACARNADAYLKLGNDGKTSSKDITGRWWPGLFLEKTGRCGPHWAAFLFNITQTSRWYLRRWRDGARVSQWSGEMFLLRTCPACYRGWWRWDVGNTQRFVPGYIPLIVKTCKLPFFLCQVFHNSVGKTKARAKSIEK